ncbi:TPA: XamI family restriction endonuclease, partial [Serratia fonticola]
RTYRWKEDIAASVDMYNEWFLSFAPKAFRETRIQATINVENSLQATNYLRNITPSTIRAMPSILPTLRMSTCPPIAVDRLIGLSGVTPTLVKSIEDKGRIPPRMVPEMVEYNLERIINVIYRMADPDIFPWLGTQSNPLREEAHRAATIIADRLCGSVANPIIRNAQEKRQLARIKYWLEQRGYREIQGGNGNRMDFRKMQPGTFSFRLNVIVGGENGFSTINIPVDAVIMPLNASPGELPLLVEAKSAGDFTNTNKRRKEEAVKMLQLRRSYGNSVRFVLFLCGYFDSGYLGYEAAEGIDWVWEHRIDDFAEMGL